MLQTINTSAHGSWPSAIVSQVNEPAKWKKDIRSKREVKVQPASVGDVALRYREAVVASSDTFAWQDIRAIHLQHSLNELVVPASDSHCLMLNLSAPLLLNARPGKGNCEGIVRAGEVAIIPALTPWSCQSTTAHSSNTLLLFLRPLFVRNAAEQFDASYKELVLTPQIGFQSKHIRHIAMSLLSELKDFACDHPVATVGTLHWNELRPD
jgi:hypothetical protein